MQNLSPCNKLDRSTSGMDFVDAAEVSCNPMERSGLAKSLLWAAVGWANAICADSAHLLRKNSALARPPREGSATADAPAQALRNIASCCQRAKIAQCFPTFSRQCQRIKHL